MATVVQFKFIGVSGGTSAAAALDDPVTAGNALIALMVDYDGSETATLTCSDDVNGAYTNLTTVGSGTARSAIAYKLNVGAGTTTPTITASVEDYISAIVIEVSGLATADALDDSASNAGTGSGTYTTGTTGTPAQDDNFVVGIFGGSSSNMMSTPSGFTNISLLNDATTYQTYSAFYRNITSAAAQSASITSGTSGAWTGYIAVFKEDTGVEGSASPAPAFLVVTNGLGGYYA